MVSKFSFSNPKGNASTAKGTPKPSNGFPGRSRNDSMRNKAGAGKKTTTASYAKAKASTSSGFANSRGREFR